MKSSEFLFELIHSLSKTEKRYFKRYTTLHGTTEKNYVQLFDDVLKMDVYNEGIVKKKYAGGYADNFGMMKQLLFQQIMKSLSSFYADSSIEHEILSIIRDIKILQKRGLYAIAEKKIDKGIKLCYEYERLGFLPQLYSHKKSNIYQSFYIDTSYEVLEKIISDEQQVFLLMNEIVVQVNIMLKFFYLRVISSKNKSNNQKSEIEKIVKKLIVEKARLHTFSAQSIRFHILATYFSDIENSKKANNIMREHIKLYRKYPKIKKEYYFNFLNINYQLADLQITTKKFSEAKSHLEELEKNKSENKGYESLFFTLHYSAFLKLLTETQEFAHVLRLEKLVESQRLYYSNNIPDEAQNHFDYCFAISHVYLNNYDKAINYLQNIINRKNNHSHFVAAKTMLFICHYELKNDSILLHLAEGALRAMNTAFKNNLPIEALLLGLFIKNTKTNNPQQFIQHAKKYLHKKENKSKKVLEPFNVLEWIENK